MGFDQIDIFGKKGVNLMKDIMFDDFKIYYPKEYERAVDYRVYCTYELAIRLSDGDTLIYDYMNKTVGHLPNYENELTEQECKNEFGLRLQRLLYSKGMTQEDLADAVGISRTIVNHYITGRVAPSFPKVYKICRAIGCSMDDLCYIPRED